MRASNTQQHTERRLMEGPADPSSRVQIVSNKNPNLNGDAATLTSLDKHL